MAKAKSTKHTPGPATCEKDGCDKHHYTCSECKRDCTAGKPAGPATLSTDGKVRCYNCDAAHGRKSIRLRDAAQDLADVLRCIVRVNGSRIDADLYTAANAALDKAGIL